MADYQEGDRYQTADGQVLVLKGNQWVPEGGTPAWVDALKSVPTGLVRGAMGLATTIPSIADLAARTTDLAAGKFLSPETAAKVHKGAETVEKTIAPVTYERAMPAVEAGLNKIGLGLHEPQTSAGRIVEGAGEYAPMAFGGEGSIAARIVKGLLKGATASAGAEGASQAAQAYAPTFGFDPQQVEPVARMLGGLGGYGLAGVGGRLASGQSMLPPLPASDHDFSTLIGALAGGAGAGLGRALSSGANAVGGGTVSSSDPWTAAIFGAMAGPAASRLGRRALGLIPPSQAAAVLANPITGVPSLTPPRITIPLDQANVTPQ